MKSSRIIALALLLAFIASASPATVAFNCTSGGRLYTITPMSSPIDITLMWNKAASDNDILVFAMDTGDLVGLGFGIVDRYESVTFGTVPGLSFDVVVVKAGGPNAKCQLNIGQDFQTLAGGASKLVVDRGKLADLARQEPRYARLREKVREHLQRKSSGR